MYLYALNVYNEHVGPKNSRINASDDYQLKCHLLPASELNIK
jgi:hypothetical protein